MGEEPLIIGTSMRCPWCGRWARIGTDAFIILQIPPDHPLQTTPIYKCAGANGCKNLFALNESWPG